MFNLIPWRKKDKLQAGDGGTSTPYVGLPSIRQMRQEFDQLFDRFFHDLPSLWEGTEGNWKWDLDVQETDDAVTVRAEAPGFDANDFDLQVRGNQFIIRASTSSESEEKGKNIRSWQQREFSRSVTLPLGIDTDHVDARYRNGVLTVTLPKTEQSKAKKIQIKG